MLKQKTYIEIYKPHLLADTSIVLIVDKREL